MSSKIIKHINLIIFLIQILLGLGLGLLHYLSTARMGVMRHIVYQNQKWERILQMKMITLLFGVLLVILLVLTVQCGVRANQTNLRICWWSVSILVVLAVIYNWLLSSRLLLIFYYGQLIWSAVIVLQLLKCLLLKKITGDSLFGR